MTWIIVTYVVLGLCIATLFAWFEQKHRPYWETEDTFFVGVSGLFIGFGWPAILAVSPLVLLGWAIGYFTRPRGEV